MKNSMILSTTLATGFKNAFGLFDSIDVIADAGFDAIDMNLCNQNIYSEEFSERNVEETCEKLLCRAKKCGVFFNQAHAPFPVYRFEEDTQKMEAYNKTVYSRLVTSIKAAGILGAEQIVVHPIIVPDKALQKNFNIEFYEKLIPYAKEYGVRIALENLFLGGELDPGRLFPSVCSYAHELADYYDSLDPEYFTVCLDVGHSALVGQRPDNAIRILGDRLHALHIHDNDFCLDLHTMPYLGKIDWEAVTAALAEIDYRGDFTFEVDGKCFKPFEKEPEILRKLIEILALTGRKLISMIEKERQS